MHKNAFQNVVCEIVAISSRLIVALWGHMTSYKKFGYGNGLLTDGMGSLIMECYWCKKRPR